MSAADFRIVPFGDVAEINVGDDVAVQLQFRIALQVVDDGDAAGDDGHVQDFTRRIGHGLIGHRRVGSAEVHGLVEQLFLSAAGTDGLVIEADAGVLLAVGLKPFGEGRIIKRRAGAVDERLGIGLRGEQGGAADEHKNQFFHIS